MNHGSVRMTGCVADSNCKFVSSENQTQLAFIIFIN